MFTINLGLGFDPDAVTQSRQALLTLATSKTYINTYTTYYQEGGRLQQYKQFRDAGVRGRPQRQYHIAAEQVASTSKARS